VPAVHEPGHRTQIHIIAQASGEDTISPVHEKSQLGDISARSAAEIDQLQAVESIRGISIGRYDEVQSGDRAFPCCKGVRNHRRLDDLSENHTIYCPAGA